MTGGQNLAAIARAVIDAQLYMTIATADATGRPWVSPVWYAPSGYGDFYWVSSPEALHSRNIAVRPEVGIVIFDSSARVGSTEAVYIAAVARELTGDELERGIVLFSRHSEAREARAWIPADVRPPALHRLYRATASEHSVLEAGRARDLRSHVAIA